SLTKSSTKTSTDNNNPNSTSSSSGNSSGKIASSNSSGNNNGSNTNNGNGTTSGTNGSNSNSPSKTSGSDSNSSNSKNTNTTNGKSSKDGTSSKSKNSTSNSGSTGTKTGNSGSQNSSKNDGSETNGKNSNKGTNNGNQTSSGSGSTQTNPKNTQPEPSPVNTSENEAIANTLDSLLNNYINVANYDSMNTLTAYQALNKPNALTYAIKQAILNQISQSTFEIDGNSYKTLQIVNNINVKLPNTNSLNSNYSIQIQGVTLSYNGISLKTSNGDSTFTIIGFKQSSYETYMENSILNWLNSDQNVLNTSNSSFVDLIQQNLLISTNNSNTSEEYCISNNFIDFTDFKVSFKQLPQVDAKTSGSFANDYWLTISAMASQPINFTNLSNTTSSNSNTVSAGTIFTWTLPYALNTISLNNNQTELEMLLNSAYSSTSTNEILPVPFGLSISITSQTNEWLSNKTIAFDFTSKNNNYELPPTWSVEFNEYADAVNLLDYGILNNVSDLGNTNKSASSFITMGIVYAYMYAFWGFSWSDLQNFSINWSSPVNGYSFMVIHYVLNTGLWWNASINTAGGSAGGFSVPAGTYFGVVIPYNKNSVYFSKNNQLIINPISLNANTNGCFNFTCGTTFSNDSYYWGFYNDGCNMNNLTFINSPRWGVYSFKFNSDIVWNDTASSTKN
ncbi:MAG: hypothetical protein IIT78_00320, partial [Mycoplasmataceae bacterium]|nr:hypothetical protein [Mycoplasmataceae bacterium]